MNLKLASLPAVQNTPQREADVFAKIVWTIPELIDLNRRQIDAVRKLDVSRALTNFASLRSVYLDMEIIRDQTSLLLEGIARAIEVETERRQS